MADHPRRGRNRPDSRAMWDESDRHNQHGGGTRDRRDNRDRYRDNRPRSRDRGHRSRSRSPVGERRERHRSRSRDRRDRDRDYGRGGRRGYESTRDKPDGRHHEKDRETDREREIVKEKEKEKEKKKDGRQERAIPRGPARRGNPRRSASPQRSPLGKVARATHDTNSPLPTRSKNRDKDSGHSSVRADLDDDNRSRKSNSGINTSRGDSQEEEERPGRRRTREKDGGEDAMDEDDDVAVEDDEMSAMQAMMGFGGFGSTKGQKVAGNNAGSIYKAKKTEYPTLSSGVELSSLSPLRELYKKDSNKPPTRPLLAQATTKFKAWPGFTPDLRGSTIKFLLEDK
ncbi:hypothetical protein E0Z10_g6808 [Xylaria hypoxylon]|uniref:U4/U6.U5 small nuclear ribonucleoprotein 27kDa protein domain-containing protein n=1 Tax=Xylaria hypoxylon TaxID=37992 RepID=A0A4Z0YRB6_9PEZI|nr:hypothetical protein E0Z10_g6808 [Xylaria hypoxylon]